MRLERYFSEYLDAQGRAVTSIRNPGLYKRLRDQALDELIDKELLWQEAQRQGIAVSDEQVSAQVGEIEAAFGSPALFERRLAEAGFDRAQYTEYTRHEMAAQQVYALLSAVDAPSEGEVEAFLMPTRTDCKERRTKVIIHWSYANTAWPWLGQRSSGSGRRRRANPCANVCASPLKWKSPTEAVEGASNAGELRFGNMPSFSPLVGNGLGVPVQRLSVAGRYLSKISDLQWCNMTIHAWHEACSSLYKGVLRRPGNRAVFGSRPW